MKKIFDFIPAHLLGLYILGVLIQFYTRILPDLYVGVFLVFVSLFFLRFILKGSVLLAVFGIGVLTVVLKEENKEKLPVGQQYYQFTISKVLKANKNNTKYYAKNIFHNGELIRNKLILTVSNNEQNFRVGDEVIGFGELKKISSLKNPFDFDYKGFLQKKNIYTQLYLKSGCSKVVSQNSFHPVRIANQWREYLSESLKLKLKNKNSRSLTEAMLLGKRGEISEEVLQNFADSGVIHVLAVSGLHVGILLLFMNFILRPLRYFKNGKLIKLLVLIAGLWLFALLAGLSSSVVRAVTMFSFVALGLLLNKENSVFHSLITSALILLLVNPFYLFDVGFQMSYLAVFAIVWIQPMLYAFWKPKFLIFDYFWKLMTVSLAAQIGVLPISLLYFHQFPALFLFTNLVVIPFIGFVLVYGILVLVLSQFEKSFETIFVIYDQVLELFSRFISWVATFEDMVFKNIYFSEMKLWVTYFLLFSVFIFIERKHVKNLKLVFVLMLIFQIVCLGEKYHQRSGSEFVICNSYRSSVFIENNGGEVKFFMADSILSPKLTSNYLNQNLVGSYKINRSVPEVLKINDEILFVVDGKSPFEVFPLEATMVCLQNSPKVNLERLLLRLRPRQIIADGSNYFSLKAKWKNTCKKLNVKFHDTNIHGAYIIK